jgi:hypothetical protein
MFQMRMTRLRIRRRRDGVRQDSIRRRLNGTREEMFASAVSQNQRQLRTPRPLWNNGKSR